MKSLYFLPSPEVKRVKVRVQAEDFDIAAELALLRSGRPQIGAVVSFVGVVRDLNEGASIQGMTLEHYPGMTERALQDICAQAQQRWQVEDGVLIHRIGQLAPCDQIVLLAIASRHRGEAFHACEFIMDFLKTQAPFWKKEHTPEGARWVEARLSDEAAAARWHTKKP